MCVGGEGGCVWQGRVDVCGRGGWMCVEGEGGCVWEGRVDACTHKSNGRSVMQSRHLKWLVTCVVLLPYLRTLFLCYL